ncbi:bifunctional DNA primase/polymerase [Mycolicibacterium aichiense]|uniref:bifunctional DNA primase/polymerase n=1 Tax=Mycolicibacterium aichiense TaxID=1799 RepID=UPI003D66858C
MVEVPDTNGLSVLEAAFAYAESGIHVGPFDPSKDKGKSCGNLLGRSDIRQLLRVPDEGKWYDHLTTDGQTLVRWNNLLGGFEAIATSPGRFGAVVVDVDVPALFPPRLREIAKQTASVKTSGSARRGHYWFSHPVPVSNNSYPWGDIRSHGGGLVLPPYPLDGRHVQKAGQLLPLPADLNRGMPGVTAIADLEDWCSKYTDNNLPTKINSLAGLLRYHEAYLPPHTAMLKTLRTALSEAVAGVMPAQAVLDTLREKWTRSPREFNSIARWCAAVAEDCDREAVEAMSRRCSGSDSRIYAGKLA